MTVDVMQLPRCDAVLFQIPLDICSFIVCRVSADKPLAYFLKKYRDLGGTSPAKFCYRENLLLQPSFVCINLATVDCYLENK